jgi:hypothetical protein
MCKDIGRARGYTAVAYRSAQRARVARLEALRSIPLGRSNMSPWARLKALLGLS